MKKKSLYTQFHKSLRLFQKDWGTTLIEVMVGLVLMSILAMTLAFVWKITEENRILINQTAEINEQIQKVKALLSSPFICTKFLEGLSPLEEVTKLKDIRMTLKDIKEADGLLGHDNSNSLFSIETPYTKMKSISLGEENLKTWNNNTFVAKPLTVIFQRVNGPQRGKNVIRQLTINVELHPDNSVKKCHSPPESHQGNCQPL